MKYYTIYLLWAFWLRAALAKFWTPMDKTHVHMTMYTSEIGEKTSVISFLKDEQYNLNILWVDFPWKLLLYASYI